MAVAKEGTQNREAHEEEKLAASLVAATASVSSNGAAIAAVNRDQRGSESPEERRVTLCCGRASLAASAAGSCFRHGRRQEGESSAGGRLRLSAAGREEDASWRSGRRCAMEQTEPRRAVGVLTVSGKRFRPPQVSRSEEEAAPLCPDRREWFRDFWDHRRSFWPFLPSPKNSAATIAEVRVVAAI